MCSFVWRLVVLTTSCVVFALSPAIASEPTGIWLTQNGDARIRVAKCGNAMCGTIIWLRDAIDAQTGRPPIDSLNADPAKRNRRIMGLRIFAMTPDGNGGFSGGIYNSDDGQTYAGQIALQSIEKLEVRGCAGPFCGSEIWSKIGR